MVMSFTKLLADRYRGRLDQDADDFLRFAMEGAMTMSVLIRDLLAYSRLGICHMTTTDCNVVCAQVIKTSQDLIKETGADVTHDVLPEVPGDPTQIGQVFQNLLGNALKFRRTGDPPRVHIAVRPATSASAPAGRYWEFSVHDNGIGIEPDYAHKISKSSSACIRETSIQAMGSASHLQEDRRTARRPDVGGVHARRRLDVLFHAARPPRVR